MEQFQSNQNNCIWKSIRSCIPNKSATQKTYSKDHKILADEFNYFFASIGENTIKKINSMAADFSYKFKETPFTPRVHPNLNNSLSVPSNAIRWKPLSSLWPQTKRQELTKFRYG